MATQVLEAFDKLSDADKEALWTALVWVDLHAPPEEAGSNYRWGRNADQA